MGFMLYRGKRKPRPRDIVLALLYLLCERKGRCLFSEKTVQKLTFLALYTYEDGGRLYFESEELRSIIDDYVVAWHGVFSGTVRDALRELEDEGLVGYDAEGMYRLTWRGFEEGKRVYKKLDSVIKEKLEWTTARFGDLSSNELEHITNDVIGLEGSREEVAAGKGLMLGTRINDLIEFAKVVKSAVEQAEQ